MGVLEKRGFGGDKPALSLFVGGMHCGAAASLGGGPMVPPAVKAAAGRDVYISPSIPSEQTTPLRAREGHMEGTAQDLPRASAQRGEEGSGPGSQLL